MMAKPVKPEWSKTYPAKRRDNLISHEHIAKRVKPFVASYEKDDCENMNWLIGMEYGRIWLKERNEVLRQRALKPKPIKNDYKTWIAKRKGKSSSKPNKEKCTKPKSKSTVKTSSPVENKLNCSQLKNEVL